jgi:hypothetical protein
MTMGHESFERRDEPPRSSDRTFGFVFAGVFAVLGLGPLVFADPVRWWSVALGAVILLVALVYPRLLAGPNRAWMWLGERLHRITSLVALALIFYAVVTPVALLRRALRHDPLRLRRDAAAGTYWIERRPPGPRPESLGDMF